MKQRFFQNIQIVDPFETQAKLPSAIATTLPNFKTTTTNTPATFSYKTSAKQTACQSANISANYL